MYDFKDPKTSGVVTVTKNWDDSSSNDKRPVPDVSISTEKPSKSALGHVITYHGNGLSFPDGSIQNEIVINNSGKIVSGQYKELYGSLGWYSDKACTQKVKVDSAGLPVNGINADLDLYAKQKTFVLKASYDFNNLIPSMATSVIFTNEIMPISATLINVDKDGDNGVVAWMDKNVMKVSTQSYGQKAIITDCQGMFLNKSNLTTIDFNNLDTSNVKDMAGMFQGCEGLTSLNLSYLKTDEVTNMSYLFYHCTGLTDLDLGSLHTHKVTDMTYMFARCSSITSLDLTSLDTSEVTSMRGMFGNCSDLTNLDLTPLDTQNVTNMSGMFSSCKSLTSMDLSPLNTKNVTDMSWIFSSCVGLSSIDLSPLDTNNVTDTSFMFYGCTGLKTLDLTSMNTSKVVTMQQMFYDCSGLTSLDLTSLDTRNVMGMSGMFQGCKSLINLDLSSLNTQKVTSMNSMFLDCDSLSTLSIGEKFAFVGTYYNLPSDTWYSSNGTAYISNGNSCTIPSNKADTYTRK